LTSERQMRSTLNMEVSTVDTIHYQNNGGVEYSNGFGNYDLDRLLILS